MSQDEFLQLAAMAYQRVEPRRRKAARRTQ
jgi:hypothetical protein